MYHASIYFIFYNQGFFLKKKYKKQSNLFTSVSVITNKTVLYTVAELKIWILLIRVVVKEHLIFTLIISILNQTTFGKKYNNTKYVTTCFYAVFNIESNESNYSRNLLTAQPTLLLVFSAAAAVIVPYILPLVFTRILPFQQQTPTLWFPSLKLFCLYKIIKSMFGSAFCK